MSIIYDVFGAVGARHPVTNEPMSATASGWVSVAHEWPGAWSQDLVNGYSITLSASNGASATIEGATIFGAWVRAEADQLWVGTGPPSSWVVADGAGASWVLCGVVRGSCYQSIAVGGQYVSSPNGPAGWTIVGQAQIPEPSTLGLLLFGLVFLARPWRKRR